MAEDDVAQRLAAIEAGLQRVERGLGAKAARPRVKITDKAFSRLAKEVIAEERTLLREDRLWTLWQAVANSRALGLPALEAGTYRGGSAAFLAGAWQAQSQTDVVLDVIDTFAGHAPGEPGEHDDSVHHVGRFGDTSFEEVSAYLARFPGVRVHEGAFATVSGSLGEQAYGLVHLDMDLYEPTIDGLRFAHDHVPPGGCVILDDYGARKCPGVVQAAEEFLAGHRGYHAWDPLSEQLVLSRWA
jgi:O-methyltransferase